MNRKFLFWLSAGAIFFALVWGLSDVLAPFVAAGIFAYILQPLTSKFQSFALPRSAAAAASLLVLCGVIIGIFAAISPVLIKQATQFAETSPALIESVQSKLEPLWAQIQDGDISQDVKSSLKAQSGTLTRVISQVFKRVFSGGIAIFDLLSLLVITPVVTFYLLRDWPKLATAFHDLTPEAAKSDVSWLTKRFDETLSAFFRGQALVCLLLGAFYAIGLSLMGLKYALLIGVFTGVLSFIPFVGSIFGLIASVGVALYQFDGYAMAGIAAAIFAVGQFLEGNILTPRVVGDKVGLHAVWVIFALMVGNQLFGFVGVLLAVPVAALIGVLIRYGIKRYRNSSFYRQESPAS